MLRKILGFINREDFSKMNERNLPSLEGGGEGLVFGEGRDPSLAGGLE